MRIIPTYLMIQMTRAPLPRLGRWYTRVPSPASPSSFNFSLFVSLPRSLCGGLLGCLGVVMASAGDVGEGSHDHDRDDHGATEEGNVRMTVHEQQA